MFVDCNLPNKQAACLYLFIKKNRVVYVGRTGNIRKRLGNHNIYDAAKPDCVLFAAFPGENSGRLYFAEELLIWSLQPKFNQTLKKNDLYLIERSASIMPMMFTQDQIDGLVEIINRFGGQMPPSLKHAIDYGVLYYSGMPLFGFMKSPLHN